MTAVETEYVAAPPADPTLATIALQLAAIEARMNSFEVRMERYEQRLLNPADVQQAFDDLLKIYGQAVQLREVYKNVQRDLHGLADSLRLQLLSDAPYAPRRRGRLLASRLRLMPLRRAFRRAA